MKNLTKLSAIYLLYSCVFIFSACGNRAETAAGNQTVQNTQPEPKISNSSSENQTKKYAAKVPNLQAEIFAQRNTKTDSPLGNFDFKKFTFPFARGWQDIDSNEFTLVGGVRPISKEKVGVSFVTTLFGDANNDGNDEAIVILKIDTGGSAIPQIVYVYSWKDEQPELIWNFRTGDRADGGLKNIWTEKGSVIIELFGQDRYILGDSETMKITGDEEPISFPAFYTKTIYKWNGSEFRLEGKRLTYKTNNENMPPVENMNEIVESQKGAKK